MLTTRIPNKLARSVAGKLIDAGCVSVRTDEPFRLPSGWASPVYMDCRRLISFPAFRRELVGHAVELLKARGCLEGLASVVGAESSGIALAAWIAEALDLPLAYVRKRPAGKSQIEGVIRPGDKVLLIDDLMAAGHSKAGFCSALASVGAQVADVFVIFDYGCFPTGPLLASFGIEVHALATWRDVLRAAEERGNLELIRELQEFLNDPPAWSQAHGGRGADSRAQNALKESKQ